MSAFHKDASEGIYIMKRIIVAVALGLAFTTIHAADTDGEAAALKAADAWLTLVDTGKYAESWRQAAPMFQKEEAKGAWVHALENVRKPLGHLVKRSVADAAYSATLPGMPDGHYWVVHEQTRLEHKASAVETVILAQSSSDWKVIGYFIR